MHPFLSQPPVDRLIAAIAARQHAVISLDQLLHGPERRSRPPASKGWASSPNPPHRLLDRPTAASHEPRPLHGGGARVWSWGAPLAPSGSGPTRPSPERGDQ